MHRTPTEVYRSLPNEPTIPLKLTDIRRLINTHRLCLNRLHIDRPWLVSKEYISLLGRVITTRIAQGTNAQLIKTYYYSPVKTELKHYSFLGRIRSTTQSRRPSNTVGIYGLRTSRLFTIIPFSFYFISLTFPFSLLHLLSYKNRCKILNRTAYFYLTIQT